MREKQQTQTADTPTCLLSRLTSLFMQRVPHVKVVVLHERRPVAVRRTFFVHTWQLFFLTLVTRKIAGPPLSFRAEADRRAVLHKFK